MQKILLLEILTFLFITPAFTQKRTMLCDSTFNGGNISYYVTEKDINFHFFYGGSYKKCYPTVSVDINKNGIIDSLVDRSYGFTTTDGPNYRYILCSQYLIAEQRTTFCGNPPSNATAIFGSLFAEFTIPKSELGIKNRNDVIHVSIQFIQNMGTESNQIWERVKYPECSGDPTCTKLFDKVYEIKIK